MATGSIKKVSNDSADNYCKMPDGTLIQWGQANIASQGATAKSKVINFQIPINNVNHLALALVANSSDDVRLTATGYTTTSFTVWVRDVAATTRYFTWLAISRWK